MTFNGEIYNYIELRQSLIEDGYEFKTDSDSEVILGMYAKYKEKCLDYFRGMFGFVIWDKQEETLFCARDQFGIKPFYYAESGNDFYYASESKAIYKVLEDKKFDKDALQDYMTFQFVPEPETLTKEIKMLARFQNVQRVQIVAKSDKECRNSEFKTCDVSQRNNVKT